ncbi:MAG: oligosaccharide flippase family protein [Candidatus Krumholzibacteriota bacterium]
MGFSLGKSVKSLMQLASANVAVKFLGILMIAFFARYLTKEELAILPVYEMLAALSGIVTNFGIQPTFLRTLPARFSEDIDEARGMVFTGGALMVSASVVFSLGIFLLADRINPIVFKGQDFAHLIRIASLGFMFVSIKNFSHVVLWSSSRFDRISVVQVTAAIGRAVFLGGFLLLWDIEGLTFGLVMNEILCASLSLYFIRDILVGPRVPFYPLRALLKKSWAFYFEGFLIYFRSQGDNWIIATLLGPAAMAVYFVAKRLPTMMLMFIESLDKIVTSEISKRQNKPDEMKPYLRSLFLVNAHMTLPGTVFVMGLAPLFILVVAGKAYLGAIVPSVILCAVLPLQALQLPLARGIFVIHQPKVRVIMTMIESAVLIISLFILTPLLEENGIALSRFVAAAGALLMSLLVMRKSIGLGLPWGQAALSALFAAIMAGVMLALQSWNNNLLLAPAYAVAGIGVFLILVSLFNSRAYYEVVNTVMPFHLPDPVRATARALARRS